MTQLKTASLFRNGRNQAVRIPVEFEMPGTEVTIRKEGDKLVLEPKAKKMTLIEAFDQMETIDIEFPDVDEGLLPIKDIEL
ncbi:MAG TPA: AbrB/MazE/SpoVT family DNA-binding domain-containing protein [Devosia sp.]|nr:AbrB/MazE/SpoVT family DNA-binding domain-containing protein [Devosia sp.]